MGFLDFFKKEEAEVIAFEDVPHWIDDYVKRKNLDSRFKQFREGVEKDLEGLKDRIEELEEAELMNPDIPDRQKHLMEGNREHYVNRMKRFVNNISVPESREELGYFASRLSEKIGELEEDTGKNFAVLQQFLEDEAKKIASKVKQLESRVLEFRQELDEEDLDLAEDVRLKLEQLSDNIKERKSLEKEKEEVKDYVEELKEKKDKIRDRIEDLKNSEDYEEFKELHERKSEAQQELEDLKKDLYKDFSTLERALKKYSHNTPVESFVGDFLDAPLQALKRDDDLEVAKILSEVKEKLPELDLKDRKQNKSRQVLEKLDEDELRGLKKEADRLEEKISDLTQELKGNVTSMNITEQEEFLKSTQRKIDEQKDKIEDIEGELSNLNPERIRQKVRKMVKELANVKFEDEVEED